MAHPCAAWINLSIQIVNSFPLEFVASPCISFVIFHALCVFCVVLIGHAKVSVKHHFFVGIVTLLNINSIPLILCCVVTDASLRSPSVSQHRFIVSIIELALVCDSTPVAIITRIFLLGMTDSVSTRESSSERPCQPFVPFFIIDVIDENRLEGVAALLGVWHQAGIIWASFDCLSSNLKLVSEFLSHATSFEWVFSVKASGHSSDNSFCRDNYEISHANYSTVLSIYWINATLLEAWS